MFPFKKALIYACLLSPLQTLAAGMVPDTSLLIINEDEKGASMDVKNTDDSAQLLYTHIVDLPDDLKPGVVVTQPVVRVDGGKTQRVRFVLKESAEKLNVEHFKRVIFSTIPQREQNKVKMVFSQNLPVIIHPAGLEVNLEPWKNLTWKMNKGNVTLLNTTPYVVRMEQSAKLLPSGKIIKFDKPYILPGQTLTAKSESPLSGLDNKVIMSPATRFGYKTENYTADLK
ncbi:fimbria/pilus chaperone family protein [Enterobacter cloacae]|uniref:fimbria/pilus chaperone family protein n=1 Tax=Enterobacter cloacae TaxID=550 RepID=UPI000BA0EA3A|nr:fimbria/pilus chaperone family protein [Enterobacter cloacae]OZU91357.1 molecular chaperone [Enterobacter cloacae]PAN81081.1 molecular chaperone [Enterobacter cloacae]PAN94176.1 molecular chaperone [Enterobacter cloacae]HAS1027788.1 fimbria/pilus periplasmic chaperone [Enterobacter cloacae]HAS1036729.1 fimbria/pilus periplasmic chaperone [Enterobacter cloacae]